MKKQAIFLPTAIFLIIAIKKNAKKIIFMFEFKQTHNLFAVGKCGKHHQFF